MLGSRQFVRKTLEPFMKHTGGAMSPFTAWIMLKGLETMDLRVRAQADTAGALARALHGHPGLGRVIHPGLPSHPQHAIYARDFAGPCSLFGVVLQPRFSDAEAEAVVDALALFGIGRLKRVGPPKRAIQTVKDDVAWIKHPTVAPTTKLDH